MTVTIRVHYSVLLRRVVWYWRFGCGFCVCIHPSLQTVQRVSPKRLYLYTKLYGVIREDYNVPSYCCVEPTSPEVEVHNFFYFYRLYSCFFKIQVGFMHFVYLLTYLLTYSMKLRPSREANQFSASQEIPRIIWNRKVHYRNHKCPQPVLS